MRGNKTRGDAGVRREGGISDDLSNRSVIFTELLQYSGSLRTQGSNPPMLSHYNWTSIVKVVPSPLHWYNIQLHWCMLYWCTVTVVLYIDIAIPVREGIKRSGIGHLGTSITVSTLRVVLV